MNDEKIDKSGEFIIDKKEEAVSDTPQQAPQTPSQDFDHSGHTNPILKWGSLLVLSLGLAIIIIDTTLLNVSLSTIIKDLKTDIQSIQWVITSYALVLAALTITGGRIGDLFGRRKMFMIGAIIFAVGSFLASVSHSVGVLLMGESIIEGVGAALMMPATASLLVANYRGKERAIAFGVWGGIAGASSAIGPILGGWLTNSYSWRWGFRINIFVAALLVLGTIFLVKESRDTKEKPKLDVVGVVLSAVGLFGIVFGIIEASTYGILFAKTDFLIGGLNLSILGLSPVPFSIILGAMVLNIFYLWEQKVEQEGKTPLVSFKIFANKTFSAGVIVTTIITLALTGLIFSLPVYLQSVLRLNAFDTGVALLPLSLVMLVMAPLSGFLSTKISIKYMIVAGLIIDTIGILLVRQGISINASSGAIAPGLMVMGLGMGMAMAQISNLTLSALPVYQAGEASGISNTMRQVGSSFGAAVMGAVLLTVLSSNITTGINKSTVIPDAVKPQFVSAVSKQTSNVEFGGGAVISRSLPVPIVREIGRIGKQASVDSARTSLIVAAFFAFLGFLSALILPNKKKEPAGGSPAGH